jgi:hypothetical protein
MWSADILRWHVSDEPDQAPQKDPHYIHGIYITLYCGEAEYGERGKGAWRLENTDVGM